MNTLPKIWLASGSPRRQALLEQIQLPFSVLKIPFDRDPEKIVSQFPDETAVEWSLRLSRCKAETASAFMTESALSVMPILTADTIVADETRVYGKPLSLTEAKTMLQSLSGRTHRVITGVTVCMPDRSCHQTVATTSVTFAPLTDKQIDRYISSCNVLDKAGSYAIQEYAGLFVSEIHGSYSNVVGLPLFETAQLLETVGIQW